MTNPCITKSPVDPEGMGGGARRIFGYRWAAECLESWHCLGRKKNPRPGGTTDIRLWWILLVSWQFYISRFLHTCNQRLKNWQSIFLREGNALLMLSCKDWPKLVNQALSSKREVRSSVCPQILQKYFSRLGSNAYAWYIFHHRNPGNRPHLATKNISTFLFCCF